MLADLKESFVSKDLFSNQLIKLVVHCMLGNCVLTVQQFHELDLPEVSYIMFTGVSFS